MKDTVSMKSKYLTKAYYQRKTRKLLTGLFPSYMYWKKAKKHYREMTGKRLNYRHPKDLNEKLMWLTRYWQHPLKTKCADKYLVREYVKECGLEDILVPLIGVYDNVDQIDFDALPDSFVLKCNHGSGFNIIVRDKQQLDIEKTKKTLSYWMSIDFHEWACEIHYKGIPRKIVCEQLLSQTAPTEYQVRMINGKPNTIVACSKADGTMQTYKENSYNLDWTPSECCEEGLSRADFARPKNIDTIVEYAKRLASPFPFVRVDFYEVEGKTYFAELTFTPSTNCLHYPQSCLDKLGSMLVLPKKIKARSIV